MNLFEKICDVYPNLENKDFHPEYGSITLADDGDGVEYILKWEYSKPIPAGLKLGK